MDLETIPKEPMGSGWKEGVNTLIQYFALIINLLNQINLYQSESILRKDDFRKTNVSTLHMKNCWKYSFAIILC